MAETSPASRALRRIEPARNMARYYSLSVEPGLFGWSILVREWGRIGSGGRRRLDIFDDRDQASAAADDLLTRKIRRGYRSRDAAPCDGEEREAGRSIRSASRRMRR